MPEFRPMTRWSLRVLVTLALLGAGSHEAAAADTDAVRQLVENAEYWRSRGRTDKVVEIYEKILKSDPNHAQSLAELAILYAQDGRKDQARAYLGRLERAAPGHPKISAIRQALDLGGSYKDLLAEARQQAKAGNLDAAVKSYREMFGDAVPSGQTALEYYQTLGGTQGGWEEARTGLARLERENPSNPRMTLALAQHLTYRESSRREGITKLAGLASDSTVGKQARTSWRQALLWLGGNASDAPLYAAYLKSVGEDAEIRSRMGKVSTAVSGGTAVADGYEALRSEDVERADEAFRWALQQRGRNVDAIVGMGIVELQRENFAEAEKLLEEAKRIAPTQPHKWEQSLASARFWRMLRDADKAREDGDSQQALQLLEQARGVSPNDAIHVDMALGNLYDAMGRSEQAEEAFRAVLSQDPDNSGALVAMVKHQVMNGQLDAAMVFNDRLGAVAPELALTRERMKAELLRYQAKMASDVGNTDSAIKLLTEATALDPDNVWARFDLFNTQIEAGDLAEARSSMDELLAEQGDLPQFRLANARLLAEEGKYNDAMAVIASTQGTALTSDMRALRERLEVQVEATMAVRRASIDSDLSGARQQLFALETSTEDKPELQGTVALAWSDLGDDERALELIDAAVKKTLGRARTTLQFQQAAILLRAGEDERLNILFAELERGSELSARERKGLDDLKVAYAVQRADTLRDRGVLAAAYDLLNPLLKQYPDQPRLVNALGRILYTAKDYEGSEAVFRRVLTDHPGDVEALQGAALAIQAQGRKEDLTRLLDAGVQAAPDDPRAHLVVGRVSSMAGLDAKAISHLRTALALAEAQEDAALALGRTRLALAGSATPGYGRDVSYDQLVKSSALRLKASLGAGSSDGAPSEQSLRSEILREIEQVDARHSIRVSADLGVRHRVGEPGLSALTEISLPITAEFPTGYTGALWFEAAPTYLDNGAVDLTNAQTYERWGSFGVNAPIGDIPSSAAGLGLRLGWKYKGFGLWAGSTPLGSFLAPPTVTAGFTVGHAWDRVGIRLVAERVPVRDSLLSFAGLTDPVTGVTWGGVTSNGGRLDFSVNKDPLLWYLYGGVDYRVGVEVDGNSHWQAGTGLQWGLYRTERFTFKTGLVANAQGFGTNQRFFSLGQGGYFSPQAFVNAAVPLIFMGETPKVRYAVEANVGVNWFHEDASDFYPRDPNLQGAREARLADEETGTPAVATYAARDQVSFSVNGVGDVAYKVTDRVEAGLRFGIYTAFEYTEVAVSLRIGYRFGRAAPRPVTTLPQFGY